MDNEEGIDNKKPDPQIPISIPTIEGLNWKKKTIL